jgi:hypothetical protein
MTTTINASTTAGLVQTADTSGVLALQTAGTTAVTVDASQNVGIGTASPDATLRIDSTNSSRVRFGFTTGGLDYGIFQSDQGSVDANFFSNKVGIGVTAPACILDISGASGGQIKFPATQNASSDANTLDDYEEGTFTPTVTFGGGSATVASFAAYIKIGKTCFVNGYVSFSSVSSASAGSITNFPFTAANISGSPRQVLVAREDAATGKMGQVFITAGSTTAALQDYAGANAGTVFANGYTWIFTGTYNTSA